jgi:hypothetical protein
MTYDFFEQEWRGICGACKTELHASSKKLYLILRNMHTHSKACLGGW